VPAYGSYHPGEEMNPARIKEDSFAPMYDEILVGLDRTVLTVFVGFETDELVGIVLVKNLFRIIIHGAYSSQKKL
jgi:hypothetical protein